MFAPKKRRWRRARQAAALAATLALIWLGGLILFAGSMPRAVADPDGKTDAIVVLTGGSERLTEGLALLAGGQARKLFISGVYRGVDITELFRVRRETPDEFACCVALGHEADDTHGNAVETAAWMKEQDFESLRLVTATYHMPRSLLEFRRALPEARILPHPVFPATFKQDGWWRWPGSARLVISEYNKYLIAHVIPGGGDF